MISRMRTGNRSASLETLQAISRHYNVSIEPLATAASKAASGDSRDWVALLAQIFDDGELDPDAKYE